MKWHQELRDPALDIDPNNEANARQAEVPLARQTTQISEPSRIERPPRRPVFDSETDTDATPSDRSSSYSYEVTLRNDGSKDVTSIIWEYVFFAPDTGQEVGRRRFTTKMSVPRGKTRTITVHSAIPPTGTVDASKTNAKAPEHYNEKIVFVSVEFADNSKWSAPQNP